MVDKLDWTAPPKEKDQLEEIEEASEVKADTEEDKEDSEEDKADSEAIETTPEIQETLPLYWARTIKTQRREPSELSQERRSFFDYSFK